jgi:hypothetical protein
MTPLKAIRKLCVECVGTPFLVQDCGGDKCIGGQGDENGQCYFFKYRNGKGRPSVKLIRKFCVECMGSTRLVSNCTTVECPLHRYRFGTNPKRKGIGRRDAFKRVVSCDFCD